MLDFGKYEAMMFDCYGTLIDWESGILAALRPVLLNHGIDLSDYEVLEKYAAAEAAAEKGEFIPYRQVLREVMFQFGGEFNFTPSGAELDCLPESIKNWPPFPDTVDALRELKKRYKLVVLSNIDDDLFAGSNKLLGVGFDHVFTAQRIGSYKPAVRNFEYAIGELGIPREKILHVAQSLFHDIAPAKEVGLDAAWINRRKGKRGFGATPPADAVPDIEFPDLKSLASQLV